MNKRIINSNADDSNSVVRASVSFSTNNYSEIEEIALRKHVSVAWVVREAVIEYINNNKDKLMHDSKARI